MVNYEYKFGEVQYGNAVKRLVYDRADQPLPFWLTAVGTLVATESNDLSITPVSADTVGLNTENYSIATIDTLRASFVNLKSNKLFGNKSISLVSEDGTTAISYRTKTTGMAGVGLYINGSLVSSVSERTEFNGDYYGNRPRELALHLDLRNPEMKQIHLMENKAVVHTYTFSNTVGNASYLDLTKRFHFEVRMSESGIIMGVSQISTEVQTSY